ncbi:MAG: TaqI-like C-terminal specificity domain-containing protein, partial [Candidatus Hodarchaeota archaeon]
ERREYYAQQFVSVTHKKARINLMNLFIERAFSLLRPGGMLVFLVNKTFLELPSFKRIRQFVVERFWVEAILPELSIFDAIVDACVIVLKKPTKSLNSLNLKKQLIKWVDPLSLVRSELVFFLKTPQAQVFDNINYAFLPLSEIDLQILNKISANCAPLGDLYKVNRGMNIGGVSEYFLADEAKTPNYYPFLQSLAQISPYKIKGFDKFVLYDKKLEQRLRKEKSATIALGTEKRFKQANILVAEAGSTIIAVLNTRGLYASYSFHVITPKSNKSFPLLFLLALLNSSVLSYFAIKKSLIRKGRKATPHLGTLGLRQLPIPKNIESAPLFEQIYQLSSEIHELAQKERKTDEKILNQKIELLNGLCYKIYGVEECKIEIDRFLANERSL